jgi:hypothetical protein
MGYPLQTFVTATYTLDAGVARTVDMPLNGASRWRLNIAPLLGGAGPVTAMQFAVSATNSTDFGPLQAPPAPTLPIALGSSAQLFSTDAGMFLRLVLTSTLGCDVTLSLGGF